MFFLSFDSIKIPPTFLFLYTISLGHLICKSICEKFLIPLTIDTGIKIEYRLTCSSLKICSNINIHRMFILYIDVNDIYFFSTHVG